MASFQANNKKRCPAKTCKNEDTRWKLFAEYVEPGRSFNAVKAKFEQILGETQRTQVKYGFRNDQWLVKHHGERKAKMIMERKAKLGLTL